MYSLDQVIYFLEQRQQTEDWNIRDAAIAYLKGYREVLPEYAQMKLDAVKNDPLTWDELKTMEGKPIWVEDHDDDDEPYNRWYIVERFIEEQDDEYAVLNGYYFSREYFNDKTDGWQAYRKERK